MRSIRFLMLPVALTVSACGDHTEPAPQTTGYTVLGTNLSTLRSEFNADAGKVRLLYIVGPTCPVCLRGMDGLGKALAQEQDDSRLRTFVVYVPELHATPADIGPTIPLLPGKEVSRYWDPAGSIEKLFEAKLKTMGPAWDVWMVYGPGQRWDGDAPPSPDFWMDQLEEMPQWRYLDPAEFAKQVKDRLAAVKVDGV